jgi:signal transduction histidine kinase
VTKYPPFERLAIGARLFGLVLLATPLLWQRDATAALALLAVGMIWLSATAGEWLRLRRTPLFLGEAALVAAVCVLAMESSAAVLLALAVPPFIASLRRGPRGLALALSVELVVLVGLTVLSQGGMSPAQVADIFTWLVMGVGLGLIASFVRSTDQSVPDPLTPYRDAQALIRQLIGLSGDLGSGLDAASVAASVVDTLRDDLPVTTAAVHVPRRGDLSPLLIDPATSTAEHDSLVELARIAEREAMPAVAGRAFAFPLMTDAGLVAVVSGQLPISLDPISINVAGRLRDLSERLEPTAVHLDTALLFTALRDTATLHERRRLAREMHDGIAQEIAFLGYLVDGIAATADSEERRTELLQLRTRLSGVVAEVRRSVQTLRTEAGSSPSLGAAIAAIGRHLSDSSGLPIRVTVDERPTRLRPEVEAELLRIAQEAMTNAVRHADATTIEVMCRVEAPQAKIVVRDDGAGLRPGRRDSHGIEIMHERARLIGAELTIGRARPHGTVLTVLLPPPTPAREGATRSGVRA